MKIGNGYVEKLLTPLSESWRIRTSSFLLCDPATIPALASMLFVSSKCYFVLFSKIRTYRQIRSVVGLRERQRLWILRPFKTPFLFLSLRFLYVSSLYLFALRSLHFQLSALLSKLSLYCLFLSLFDFLFK